MDFDNAKENIMPLAGGRDARCLETVLSVESHHEALVLLKKQREEYENAIHEYVGDDPLEPWFNYIQWIEQSYPSGGKENGLFEVLNKCLTTFDSEKKYFQDRRMIKLLIKYIDSQSNPQEYYQELYNQGIGTMVSDLYICWAYYYDLCGNFAKAEDVFRKGLDAKAQPLDELEQAHKHFGFTMSQRILYKDEASNLEFMSSMQERRHALTSLRTQRKKVGSIRTGTAIKNHNPGKVELSKATGSTSNIVVKVFEDENHDPNAVEPHTRAAPVLDTPTPRSVVRSIIDSTRKQENMREPGPWSKARINDKRRCDLFGASSNHELAFEIMQDEDVGYRAPLPKGADKYSIGIQLPPDFVLHNVPLSQWEIPLYSDPGTVGPNIYPQYEKTQLYPKENEVYCPEEYVAWQWFKKRGLTNEFTEKHDHVWCANFEYGFHHYPKFCMNNLAQTEFVTKRFIQDEDLASDQVLVFPVPEVYPEDSCEEFQIEEIRRNRIRDGKRKLNLNMDETIIMREDLDETQCVVGVTGRDRRSTFATRKSIVQKNLQTIVESPGSHSLVSPNGDPRESSQRGTSTDGIIKPAELPIVAKVTAVPNNEEENIQEVVSNEDSSNKPAVEKIRDSDMIESVNENNDNLRTVDNLRAMKKFDIYEDTTQSGDCVFKAPQLLPQAIARSVKSRKSVVPLQEDPIEEKTNLFPESETTCSTQTFNFFIKGHAISTPKHLRKSQSNASHLQERPSQPEFASPPTDPTEEDALSTNNSNTQYPPKQLSIIMETTETNTGSSGTKSSGETQELELLIESNKSHQTIKTANKEKCAGLNPILEVPSYEIPTLQKLPRIMQHEKETTTAAIEDSIPALMTSLKVFEDKTETVPKMLLVKPPMNVPSNDNFEILFTTTPPKGATKVNCSAINESLTFSKLSEVTIPKMEEVGKDNLSSLLKEAPVKKENKFVGTGAISKKTEPSFLGSFSIDDSVSFSNLKNFTMSNFLERRTLGKNEKFERTSKRNADKSLEDRSLLQMLDISAADADENEIGDNKHMQSIRKTSFTTPKEGDISKIDPLRTIEPVDRTFANEYHIKKGSYIGGPSTKTEISLLQRSQINEPSLHIKEEADCDMAATGEQRNYIVKPECSLLSGFSALSRRQAGTDHPDHPVIPDTVGNFPGKDRSIDMTTLVLQKDIKREYCDLGRSIYKKSPGTPEFPRHIWVDDDGGDSNSSNNFVHDDIDLDLTKQLIDAKIDENANPFDPELIKAFLDQIDLCSFVENLPECQMVNRVQPLQKGSSVHVADKQLEVMKLIGEGSYGSVFRAKDRLSGKSYAIKQEKPANLWEYYICLELKSRISPNVMFGFMNVEYAVIGNNASLLITQFSEYGSLINVCHKVYKATGKNLDEYVVMVIASQLLSIMDHLHASNIIHADVKPDNFLLMSKLAYPSKIPSVQLIDFGVSIDLRLFPPKQSFKYVTRTQGFTCIEMLENRPWTYQPDLFGLAGTIHALLFGKYMDVERKGANWGIKTHMPRYFSKTLWSVIFNTLLNIRDCESMPNLQYLRGLLEEEIVEKKKVVRDKIAEFNMALN